VNAWHGGHLISTQHIRKKASQYEEGEVNVHGFIETNRWAEKLSRFIETNQWAEK